MQLTSKAKVHTLESLVVFDLFWQEFKQNYLYSYMEWEGERARDFFFFFSRIDFAQQPDQNHQFLLQVFFKWWFKRSFVLVLQLPYVSLGACG